MPQNTFTLIEKITVGAAGASSVTFTSIPQTYTDLKVVISARGSYSALGSSYKLSFNGSDANFTIRALEGAGGSGVSSFTGTQYVGSAVGATATSNTFSNGEIYIPNYTSANNKSFSVDAVSENNGSEAYADLIAGLWSNTAAITSIGLTPTSGTFNQYSTFYLYGIAKEGVSPSTSSAPYATGGDSIVFDGTYWIHTFTSSGTFTPRKNITCDYLVVAGGGGGGARNGGGGGGAGGLRSTVTATGGGGSLESALSLLANTGYTVTVGAGGAGGSQAPASTGSNGSNSVFSTITATGGGGGGTEGSSTRNGVTGGSGGGGASSGTTDGNGGGGTTNEGRGGGTGTSDNATYRNGGGGGGADTGGSAASSTLGGNGGNGVATSITGSSVTYAGGGGGGNLFGTGAGSGGTGGGGAGGNGAVGTNGTANRGGGGGGTGSGANPAASGGSGIVIVRYAA